MFDADATVHELYSENGLAVEEIRKIFPEAIVNNSVDRRILSTFVLNNVTAIKTLESIVHPLVSMKRDEFYKEVSSHGYFAAVYDIPLLFETNLEAQFDYIIVVSASSETQRNRVLSRPGMTINKFESILQKQVPDDVKQTRAHYVINTDYDSLCELKSQICKIIESIIIMEPDKFDRWKTNFYLIDSLQQGIVIYVYDIYT